MSILLNRSRHISALRPKFLILQRRQLTSKAGVYYRNRITFTRVASGGLALACGVGLVPFALPRRYADAADSHEQKPTTSIGSLIRAFVVYSMCSIPGLVDVSPKLLEMLTSVPIVKNITEAIVRITFFDQFVGGDTAEEVLPVLQSLRSSNVGAIFAYSVEVDERAGMLNGPRKKAGFPIHKRIVNEMIHSVELAADFEDAIVGRDANAGRRTWVAVKMTALVPDAQALINLSSYITANRPPSPSSVPFPGCPRPTDLDVLYSKSALSPLSPEDTDALRELHADLIRICSRARERGVKIILDAEYSWYQPAVDALQLSLMRQFNNGGEGGVQPLVYGTFQAYLRRTPLYLAQSLADAQAGGYALGVKLVRGAYHPHEVAACQAKKAGKPSLFISPEERPPVWDTKVETDRCFNECARVLVGEIKKDIESGKSKKKPQRVGVLFGTHNWESCDAILSELVNTGLAKQEGEAVALGIEVTERVTFGQLFGMMDALTDYLTHKIVSTTPTIVKYVPYGALSEVMPYLGRRAIENKSILGNGAAQEERRRAGREIRKRLLG